MSYTVFVYTNDCLYTSSKDLLCFVKNIDINHYLHIGNQNQVIERTQVEILEKVGFDFK